MRRNIKVGGRGRDEAGKIFKYGYEEGRRHRDRYYLSEGIRSDEK